MYLAVFALLFPLGTSTSRTLCWTADLQRRVSNRELLVKCYVGEDDYFLDYIHNQIDDFELALAMDGKKNDIEKSCIRQRLEIMAKVANQIEKKINNTIVHVSTILSLPCLEIGKGKH